MIGCEWEKILYELSVVSKTKRLWDFLVVGIENNNLISNDQKMWDLLVL